MLWLMRTLLRFAVVSIILASSAAGQTQPDFSGRWVLIDPIDAAGSIARTLVVQQPIARTNAYGAPMPPAFLKITIERHFVGDTRTDVYQIGLEGGKVFGGNAPIPQTRFSVRWDGDRLVIDTASYSGPSREAGPYTERSETWQLERQGTLRVTIDDRGSAIESMSITTRYRRQ
jgi:hypothetical protein